MERKLPMPHACDSGDESGTGHTRLATGNPGKISRNSPTQPFPNGGKYRWVTDFSTSMAATLATGLDVRGRTARRPPDRVVGHSAASVSSRTDRAHHGVFIRPRRLPIRESNVAATGVEHRPFDPAGLDLDPHHAGLGIVPQHPNAVGAGRPTRVVGVDGLCARVVAAHRGLRGSVGPVDLREHEWFARPGRTIPEVADPSRARQGPRILGQQVDDLQAAILAGREPDEQVRRRRPASPPGRCSPRGSP